MKTNVYAVFQDDTYIGFIKCTKKKIKKIVKFRKRVLNRKIIYINLSKKLPKSKLNELMLNEEDSYKLYSMSEILPLVSTIEFYEILDHVYHILSDMLNKAIGLAHYLKMNNTVLNPIKSELTMLIDLVGWNYYSHIEDCDPVECTSINLQEVFKDYYNYIEKNKSNLKSKYMDGEYIEPNE